MVGVGLPLRRVPPARPVPHQFLRGREELRGQLPDLSAQRSAQRPEREQRPVVLLVLQRMHDRLCQLRRHEQPRRSWRAALPLPRDGRAHARREEPHPRKPVEPAGGSLSIKANCANPTTNATICDPRLRTANTQAECGSADDFYFFSPWRAPGSAPVIDACGSAGGRFAGQGIGGAGAQFQNSSLARQGDKGSQLPAMPSHVTWKAGSDVEVAWTVMANHGGGYAYRLAPADAPLTEETFRKLPLDFVGKSILRWDGDSKTELQFEGWRTSVGTLPPGSMWSKNPIPSGLWEREGPGFEPVCAESEECKRWASGFGGEQGVCRCSGYSNLGPLLPNLEIVDLVQIPRHLKAGKYVLQWRWDCEESDQVWASCADVTIG